MNGTIEKNHGEAP